MKYLCIIATSLLLLFSCNKKTTDNSATPSTPTETPSKTQDLSFETIGKGALYGAGAEDIEKGIYPIQNQTDWEQLKQKMDKVNPTSKDFSITTIDFEKHTVIAVVQSVQSVVSSIAIESIIKDKDRNVIQLKKQDNSGFGATAMSQPYQIIQVAKTTKPFTIKW